MRDKKRIEPICETIQPQQHKNLVVASSTTSATTSESTNDDIPHLKRCSISSSSSTSSSKSKRSVKFDKVVIRKFDIGLGDNPSCSRGAPISLSWEYDPIHQEYPVDEYETHYRVHRKAQKISMDDRHLMLVECGVHLSEIIEAIEECQRVLQNRVETIATLQQRRPQVANRFLQAIIDIFL